MTDHPCILVVDDDPAITRMLGIALRSAGLEVVTAARGFGLLNLIAEHHPALVVLDAMMPGLDGASITELVRQDPDLAATPIILYSAMDEPNLERTARTCGADGFVPKTAGPRAVVEEVLRRIQGR